MNDSFSVSAVSKTNDDDKNEKQNDNDIVDNNNDDDNEVVVGEKKEVKSFDSLLKEAQSTDLTHIEKLDCVYIAPYVDSNKYPIIVLGLK